MDVGHKEVIDELREMSFSRELGLEARIRNSSGGYGHRALFKPLRKGKRGGKGRQAGRKAILKGVGEEPDPNWMQRKDHQRQ